MVVSIGLAPAICSSSKSSLYYNTPSSGCSGAVTYLEGLNFCREMGARLCTRAVRSCMLAWNTTMKLFFFFFFWKEKAREKARERERDSLAPQFNAFLSFTCHKFSRFSGIGKWRNTWLRVWISIAFEHVCPFQLCFVSVTPVIKQIFGLLYWPLLVVGKTFSNKNPQQQQQQQQQQYTHKNWQQVKYVKTLTCCWMFSSFQMWLRLSTDLV